MAFLEDPNKKKIKSAPWLSGRIDQMNTYDQNANLVPLSKIPVISKTIDNLNATAMARKNIKDPQKAFASSLPDKQEKNVDTNLRSLRTGPDNKVVSNFTIGPKLNAPIINTQSNALRNQELGKMTSSSISNPDGSMTNNYNIGDSNLSYKLSPQDMAIKKSLSDIDNRIAAGEVPTPEQAQRTQLLRKKAGFTRGGTDRRLANMNEQVNGTAANYERKFRNMGTSQRVAEPTVTPEQLKQYDYQEGLKSGRYARPSDPTLGMEPKDRAAYKMKQLDAQNDASNIKGQNTLRDIQGQVAQEQIDEGKRQSALRLEYATAAPERQKQIRFELGMTEPKPDVRVIDVPDGLGGTMQKVVRDTGGGYTDAMATPQSVYKQYAEQYKNDPAKLKQLQMQYQKHLDNQAR